MFSGYTFFLLLLLQLRRRRKNQKEEKKKEPKEKKEEPKLPMVKLGFGGLTLGFLGDLKSLSRSFNNGLLYDSAVSRVF